MNRKRSDIINDYLKSPEKMLLKKPFLRGTSTPYINDSSDGCDIDISTVRAAVLPRVKKKIISQERFVKELDPNSHNVIFDENLPSICVKLKGEESYREISFKRFGIALQQRIVEKVTLSLCGNKRVHILHDSSPNEQLKKNFADFKWHWEETNQDGIEAKAVATQCSYGDVGLLVYMNEKNEVKSRVLSYADGYQIISHKDDNGEPLLDCVYYQSEDGVSHIDAYDDKRHYHFVDSWEDGSSIGDGTCIWHMDYVENHGFSESPLVTKRGNVAWNEVQDLIELFEIVFNLFAVIQKRHGWGILYIKGKINETAKKIAGSIILNDTSIDGKGSAEFKAPPSPQNMLEFLQSILDQIQVGCGCTFILPKDVKSSGDISGLAIQMTRALDIERTSNAVIEWQNFVSKHSRLFKEGLAKQLVATGENKRAITEFAEMRISTSFKPWQPFDENTWNQMVCTLYGSGLISRKTGIERITISSPDEEIRMQDEDRNKQDDQEAQIVQNVTQKSDGSETSIY